MNFEYLSDYQLETETLKTAQLETKVQIKLLHLLAEIEKRRLYSKTQPSLYEYCVKTLKLSNGSAQRRIDTMRAIKLVPEIEAKITSGDLNMSSVSQAQSFFRQEKKLGAKYTNDQKKQVLLKLENKSSKECTQELIAISPLAVPQEKRRELTPDKTELKVILNSELLAKLDQIKSLWSHKNPNMTDAELIEVMADFCLQKIDPANKSVRAPKILKTEFRNSDSADQTPTINIENQTLNLTANETNRSRLIPPSEVRSRYIPNYIKKQVWTRDQGSCAYPGCRSTHRLEYDHVNPYSCGGDATLENLRLVCKAHNQRHAIDRFGQEKVNAYCEGNARI